jgi:hypothetical protein
MLLRRCWQPAFAPLAGAVAVQAVVLSWPFVRLCLQQVLPPATTFTSQKKLASGVPPSAAALVMYSCTNLAEQAQK